MSEFDPDDPMLLVPGPDAPHGYTIGNALPVRRNDKGLALCNYPGCNKPPLDPVHLTPDGKMIE